MQAPIRHASLPITRWKNGAGRKADIASGEGWRVGFAWLDADAPFSEYPGHDRTITLIDGPGFILDRAGRNALHIDQRNAPSRFDGSDMVHCRILGAACRVLNVMTSRARFVHDVAILPAEGASPPASAPHTRCLLVALSGNVALEFADAAGIMLAPPDATWLTTPTRAAGDGLICIITIEPSSD